MATDLERLREIERLITTGEDRSVSAEERLKKVLKKLRSYRAKLSKKIEEAVERNRHDQIGTSRSIAHLAGARAVAAEQRKTVNDLKTACYEIFKEEYTRSQRGAAYQVKQPSDFVQLTNCIKLQTKEADLFTEETWRAACINYFSSPFRSYTLAYLAVHYGEYYTSPRDRFGIPEVVNGESTAQDTTSSRNVRNIRDGLKRLGVGDPPSDFGPDNPKEPVGLLPAGTRTR